MSPWAHYKTGACCPCPASRVAPMPGGMNCPPQSPASPAPRCSTLLPIHGNVRGPLPVKKFRSFREKGAVGSRCPQSNMFSANGSAFALCNLPPLVMHGEVEGQAGAGVWSWRSRPMHTEAILPQPLVATAVPSGQFAALLAGKECSVAPAALVSAARSGS